MSEEEPHPPVLGRCPSCDGQLAWVITMGPHTHNAQPCGCRLTAGQIRALL